MNNPDSFFDEVEEWEYLNLIYPTKRNGNENMDKQFYVTQPKYMEYKTYEDAEKAAKQFVARNHCDQVILKAIALANTPTPDVEVTKL